MLEARRQKVIQGVHDAEAAEVKLRDIEEATGGILAKAGSEADDMLKKARVAAAQKEHALVAAAEAAAARTTAEAAKQALELKAQALEESKQEVAKLIVLGMEKMMTNK
jgi:F0F1-type ATP synthase membrane subunit b/b'